MGTCVGGRLKEMSVREHRKILRSATGRAVIIRGDCQHLSLVIHLAEKHTLIKILILVYSYFYIKTAHDTIIYYLDLENWIDKYCHLTIRSISKKRYTNV